MSHNAHYVPFFPPRPIKRSYALTTQKPQLAGEVEPGTPRRAKRARRREAASPRRGPCPKGGRPSRSPQPEEIGARSAEISSGWGWVLPADIPADTLTGEVSAFPASSLAYPCFLGRQPPRAPGVSARRGVWRSPLLPEATASICQIYSTGGRSLSGLFLGGGELARNATKSS